MPNRWVTHVKQYAKDHKMSYRQALTDARASYQPLKQHGSDDLVRAPDGRMVRKDRLKDDPFNRALRRSGNTLASTGVPLLSDFGRQFAKLGNIFNQEKQVYMTKAETKQMFKLMRKGNKKDLAKFLLKTNKRIDAGK